VLTIEAPRGKILDREGRVLASNRPAFCVSLLHMGVENLDVTADRLAPILGTTPEAIKERVEARMGRYYEPVPIETDIDERTYTLIEERRLELPGVVVETRPARLYPGGSLAAHVLGYLGEISDAELETLREQGYRPGDVIGKTGIEKVYDPYLRGQPGIRHVEVDYLGRPVRVLGSNDPQPGNDVVLTIDSELQRVAEEALAERMEELHNLPSNPRKNARAGAAVAIDPRTGEILAMASYPAFDPNLFVGGIDPSAWRALETNELDPMNNRAVLGEYAPGSAFKMVTLTAALERGVVSKDEVFDTNGGVYWVIPKTCWKAGGHGVIDLTQALAKSCNVVFYELGRRAGIDAISRYAREFGLGSKTGLRDLPQEKAGLVPSREWKEEHYKRDPHWWLAETLDAAIGQGFHQYTPLQLANYVASIANGGTLYRPYLVRKVVSPQGQVICEFEPQEIGRVHVQPETMQFVRNAMRQVMLPGGTAYTPFADFPIPVAGKTGTAEKGDPSKDPDGWFLAFAPYDNPTIAVVVLVEQGGGGSLAAAPVARRMFEAYFEIEPLHGEEETGGPSGRGGPPVRGPLAEPGESRGD